MTSSAELPCYALINVPKDIEFPSDQQLKEKFEKGDSKTKTEALKKLILMLYQGEKMSPSLMMYVIRFCLPNEDHALKKVLLLFWEIVPKTTPDGKLLHEMILVCDAYRKDLQHPNEFIRGSTLRFLCKLKEPELLEPLMPAIRACLDHSHSYVRRNAVLAIYTIYSSFDFLISDAPEIIHLYLEGEQDASCKRNAFIMLSQVDQTRALEYLSGRIEQVNNFNDTLQLIIVELIYKVCHTSPGERSKFIRCVYNLLQSQSPAVRYDAAGTLVTLSTAPAAIKTAAQTYIDLIVKQSDNNVKLIVLDRLIELREQPSSEKVLQELVMDILRVLSSSDYEVRKKILHFVLDLVSNRNVEEMVMFLKKEINKTTNETQEDVGRYRQSLVRTLHSATIKFPDVAQQIFPVLMEFLSDQNDSAAADVLVFVREAIQRLPHLRNVIVVQLLEVFGNIRNIHVFRAALWVLGEYSNSNENIAQVFRLIKKSIGELPIVESEEAALLGTEESVSVAEPVKPTEKKAGPTVTADGTYATQSALLSGPAVAKEDKPLLRKALLDGNFFYASTLATVLTKLFYRYSQLNTTHPNKVHQFGGEILFVLSSIIRLGKSTFVKSQITEDDLDRISTTIRLIVDNWPGATDIFLNECRASLDLMLDAKGDVDRHEDVVKFKKLKKIVQVDDPIHFTQLATRIGDGQSGVNLFELSLSQALGTAPKAAKFDFASSKLGKVIQLSGFSDPIYAEAYVIVHQYDIVLDVLIVNQTDDTLQNVSLELSTVGDLKLVDKPTPLTLAPQDFTNIKATVKVTSTENGIIFSMIAYDVRGNTSDRLCVYLQDIRIDIMDYIVPGSCTDTEFRTMWVEFEWENKVTVNTPITSLRGYLDHIAETTNMKLLTADAALAGDCGFLAANFCAHSIFGEDALVNISIEKADHIDPSSPIIGHIRIRAKSQGMALSIGDKINSAQKEKPKNKIPTAA